MKLKAISCDKRFRFYCYYCDKDITPPDRSTINGMFNCEHCPNGVQYICAGDLSNPDIEYIQLFLPGYFFELSISDIKSKLFSAHPNGKRLITLPYLLNVTPTTAPYWLDKLLNLMAFS